MNNKKFQSLNLNEKVAVKLTNKGQNYLESYLNKNEIDKRIIKLNGDVLVINLWLLIKIFGPQMDIGNEAVFQDMKIIIPDESLKEIKAKPKKDREER